MNDTEIVSIARLAESLPVDVRFIEFMPTGDGKRFERITGNEIFELLLEAYPDLTQDIRRRGFGPARYFSSCRLQGSIGLIDAIGNCFCPGCNRVRLTSDGFLKLCLFHDDGLDLRGMLRNGADEAEIEAAFERAVYHKPEQHLFGSRTSSSMGIKNMARIGG
jgi:cyclic pyranopterin phosphate synthase